MGTEGLSDAFVHSLEEAFNTRELLKIKVLPNAPAEAREVGNRLQERIPGLEVPQTIGRTVVLYRPFPEDPEIQLPAP